MPDGYAVFWDIDGTIVRGSLERPFFRFLRDEGHIGTVGLIRNALGLLFSLCLPRWYHFKLVYLRGLKVSDVEGWMNAEFEVSVKKRLFTGSVEAVRDLNQGRVRQVLLTGAPKPWAERIGRLLGISEIIAAEPEYDTDHYTGRLLGGHPRGRRKVLAAERWLRAAGYDWSHTVALANHYDDRFLLNRVAFAVAVNPDTRLRQEAVRQGWQIVDDPQSPFVVKGLTVERS